MTSDISAGDLRVKKLHAYLPPRWVASIGIVLMVLAGTTAIAVANLSGSTFEGDDGNLNVNTAGNTDWANVAGLATGIDNPSGTGDNSFGQGTKEDNAAVTVVTGSIPPNKSDLIRFYEASETTGGQTFLYLAWERTNVLGSANMDFEINQAVTPGLGNAGPHTINRTAGDLLITYDFTNGGSKPTLGLLFWVTSGSTSQCFSSNSLPCWGGHISLTSSVSEGAINTVTVTDPLAPNAPRTLAANTFGEAAINLTGAGVFPPGVCEAFGSVFLKSRSSASFTAEVKDFVAPVPVNISNCGTVKIHKTDEVGTPLAGAVFTLFTDNTPTASDGQTSHGAEDVATSLSCTTGSDGNCSILNVPFGDYWAVETTGVPNHDSAADQAVHLDQNTPNKTVSLTFINPRQPGAILVTKTAKNKSLGAGPHPLAGATFTVDGVSKLTDSSGQACFDGLTIGTAYTVTETAAPSGYSIDTASQSVTIDHTATCSSGTPNAATFTDTPLSRITVTFTSLAGVGVTTATIQCTGEANPSDLLDSSPKTLDNLVPGTYACTVVIDP